jgi:hypothetical protein
MVFLFSVLAVSVTEENPEVTQLLQETKQKAAVLSRDADEMEALTRSDVSWESHASMLDTMKEDVNDLARDVEVLRQDGIIAIPRAGMPEHVREDRTALDLRLSEEDLKTLDRAFPPPSRKEPLEMH